MEYQDSVRPFPLGGSHSTHACTLRTCIHKFSPASLLTSPSGSQDGTPVAITALSQSPAIDVIGIGFASGEISVYDIRMDERLLRMKMQDGAVRALSFRSGMSKVIFYACRKFSATVQMVILYSRRRLRTGISLSGISTPAEDYSISCEVPTTVLYLKYNGFPVNLCSSPLEKITV